MAKISSTTMRRMEGLEEARRKWDRVHSYVEQASGQKADMAVMKRIGRTAADVGRVLDGAGYSGMSQTVNELCMMVRRTTTNDAKIRNMRELVAAVRTGIDQAGRALAKEAHQAPQEEEGGTE